MSEPMPAYTLKALQQSITKWQEIATGSGIDYGHDNCDLCQLFLEQGCIGCPVEKAAYRECGQTPYREWATLQVPDIKFHRPLGDSYIPGRQAMTDKAKEIARRETEFLQSLLPLPRDVA